MRYPDLNVWISFLVLWSVNSKTVHIIFMYIYDSLLDLVFTTPCLRPAPHQTYWQRAVASQEAITGAVVPPTYLTCQNTTPDWVIVQHHTQDTGDITHTPRTRPAVAPNNRLSMDHHHSSWCHPLLLGRYTPHPWGTRWHTHQRRFMSTWRTSINIPVLDRVEQDSTLRIVVVAILLPPALWM